MAILFQTKRILNGLRRRIIGDRHVDAFYKLKALRSRGSILFTPQHPHHPGYLMTKLCADLGLRPVTSGNADIAMLWHDATFCEPPPAGRTFINGRCLDISKRRMETAFETVFGYSLAINPLTHVGHAVAKGEENAVHDGQVIICPIDRREEGKVYEVLIDNSISTDVVEDLRVVVAGNQLPIVYRKRRWKLERFLNTNFEVLIASAAEVYSDQEQRLMVRFAREIGLDFGELDTLRDASSGKLYIVDAAKTAFGPPARLNFLQKIHSVNAISRAFKEEFIDGTLRREPMISAPHSHPRAVVQQGLPLRTTSVAVR